MHSVISKVPTERRAVAFTFDDGPNPVYTPQLFDIFREANAKATFFMIGSQIEANPELARKASELGHEIGNHTYTHPFMTRIGEEECRDELARMHALIESATGQTPRIMRPPYFDWDERTAAISAGFGYAPIGAVNGEAMDWEQPGVDHIANVSRAAIEPGAILIFHDGFGDRSQSVEAVRRLVGELTAQGWELVTVSELLASAKKE